ncbi:hypothetical protein SASPL_115560 [Salvia splendens]|uniref:Interferon-related developmental regulator N-terminal domain-containing protein n=1 Tax=Salvia splendens TaxID=180675 RepID=A0A8X8Y7U0_SALSN|nr:hypothetical protein SASPL_115560 [Salvia splendens]
MGIIESSQKKFATMLDSDDTDSMSSSTSSMHLDNMTENGLNEVQVDKDDLLDQCLDALYEKRGSTREKALASIIESFNSSLQNEFVETNFGSIMSFVSPPRFATLLQQCLNSIKKGSAKEVALASHAIGLLAVTVAQLSKLSPWMPNLLLDIAICSQLLQCLAVITFVGGEDPEQKEKSMHIMWQVAHPKLGANVAAFKPSPAVIAMMVSSWSILYFSTLLDKDDRALRIAACEALALIFEIGSLDKFCGETKDSSEPTIDEGKDSRKLMYLDGLRTNVLGQVHGLSAEAGGKDLVSRQLEVYLTQLIQLNFLKHFLGGGFAKHMQENQFLHDVCGFTPKRKLLSGTEQRMSGSEKGRNAGHFAVDE